MIDLNKVLDTSGKRIECGNYCVARGDTETAVMLYKSAIELEPSNVHARVNAATALLERKEPEEALELCYGALAIEPTHAHALGTMGRAYMDLADFNSSRNAFEQSLWIDPKNSTTLLNYAYMLQAQGDFNGALDKYTRVRDMDPLKLSARFQRSLVLMTLAKTQEQWDEALQEYEIRSALVSFGHSFSKPRYSGIEKGKSLLLVAEQGLGDCVMMARYARYLKDSNQFSTIYILCKPEWVWILSQIEGVDGCYTAEGQVPSYDYYIPMMSLMYATGYPKYSPPSMRPYITNQFADFTFPSSHKINIGLCWQGNPQHGNDRWRSIGMEKFCSHVGLIPGSNELSLHTSNLNKGIPSWIQDVCVNSIESLVNTISKLDLVITVDTAILHIAGAMGIPTFAIIPANPDFRWGTDGSSGWYPSVRLFRATKPLEWDDVLSQVHREAIRFVGELENTGVASLW